MGKGDRKGPRWKQVHGFKHVCRHTPTESETNPNPRGSGVAYESPNRAYDGSGSSSYSLSSCRDRNG